MYSGKYRIFPQHLVSVAQTAVHKEKSIIGRTVKISLRHRQGYANPRRQVSLTNKLCTAMPKICGSSVKKNLLDVTLLVPRIWRWVQDLLENFSNPVSIVTTLQEN